jgi:hypothetical protein
MGIVTPLPDFDTLDTEDLERLFEHTLAGGGNIHP